LTPAEALVLLDPTIKQGRNPFKLSLMWLLAQKHLVASEQRIGWFKKRTTRLQPGPRAGQPLSPDLQAVMDTVRDAHTGLMDAVVAAAVQRYGHNLLGFQTGIIYPALCRRGLIQLTRERFLYFSTRERWSHTPAGKAMCARLEALMEDARRIPAYLDNSPAQAAALAAALGGLILLLPELRPHLESIANVMQRPPSGDGGSSSSDGGETSSGAPANSEQDAGLSQTPEFNFNVGDFDTANFDSLDASLSALDTSFDASSDSSDGGGDGGGGGD